MAQKYISLRLLYIWALFVLKFCSSALITRQLTPTHPTALLQSQLEPTFSLAGKQLSIRHFFEKAKCQDRIPVPRSFLTPVSPGSDINFRLGQEQTKEIPLQNGNCNGNASKTGYSLILSHLINWAICVPFDSFAVVVFCIFWGLGTTIDTMTHFSCLECEYIWRTYSIDSDRSDSDRNQQSIGGALSWL